MIKLEYDVNTSGTRVSFVIRDGMTSCETCMSPDTFSKLGRREGDTYVIPQTPETLSIIAAMVKHAKKYAKDHPSPTTKER